MNVDGYIVRNIASSPVEMANRYMIELGSEQDGWLLLVIARRDLAQLPEAQCVDFLKMRVREALADQEREVRYFPGRGPMIRKETPCA